MTYSSPPPVSPPPVGMRDSNRGIISIVLGVLGIVCCQIFGPIAWWMGAAEIKAARAGEVPAKNEGQGQAGLVLGIVGTVLLALGAVWMTFFGGIAMLGALSGRH